MRIRRVNRMLTKALAAVTLAFTPSAGMAAPSPGQRDVSGFAAQLRQLWKSGEAKSIMLTMPLHGRQLRFDLPVGYVAVYEVAGGGQYLQEFIPDGETLDSWTSMITVRSVAGGGRLPMSTPDLAERLLRPTDCAKDPFFEDLGEADLGSGLQTRIITFGCGDTGAASYQGTKSGLGEQDFGYVARSADHLHFILVAKRTAAFPSDKLLIASKNYSQALGPLGNVMLCADTASKRARPCALWRKPGRRSRHQRSRRSDAVSALEGIVEHHALRAGRLLLAAQVRTASFRHLRAGGGRQGGEGRAWAPRSGAT